MKFRLSACLTAMMALACAGGASAETVAICADNTWHAFDIDELMSASGGLDWISIEDGSTLSFTFTTAADTLLTIVDAGFAGDSFNIFDNGVLLGVTSTPVQTDSSVVPELRRRARQRQLQLRDLSAERRLAHDHRHAESVVAL